MWFIVGRYVPRVDPFMAKMLDVYPPAWVRVLFLFSLILAIAGLWFLGLDLTRWIKRRRLNDRTD